MVLVFQLPVWYGNLPASVAMPLGLGRVTAFPLLRRPERASRFPVTKGETAAFAMPVRRSSSAQSGLTTKDYGRVTHTVFHGQYPVFNGASRVVTAIKLLENECSPPPPQREQGYYAQHFPLGGCIFAPQCR